MNMAGYGVPGTASTGLGTDDGLKRAGSNIAEHFGDDPPGVFAEDQYWLATFNSPGNPNVQPLEIQVSPGDSGSGWFANIDGTTQLVGIADFRIGDYNYGSLTGAIRVSLYNDWIDQVSGIPEPSIVALLLLTVPLMRWKGRRVR